MNATAAQMLSVHFWSLARVLNHLGYFSAALGQDEAARRYFLKALQIGVKTTAGANMANALVGMPTIQARQGEVEQTLGLVRLNIPDISCLHSNW